MEIERLGKLLRLMADMLDKDALTALGIENDERWPGDVLAFEVCDAGARAVERLGEVTKALEPFAREYRAFDCAVDACDMLPDDHRLGIIGEWPPMHMPMEAEFTFGDLKRAQEIVGSLSDKAASAADDTQGGSVE